MDGGDARKSPNLLVVGTPGPTSLNIRGADRRGNRGGRGSWRPPPPVVRPHSPHFPAPLASTGIHSLLSTLLGQDRGGSVCEDWPE